MPLLPLALPLSSNQGHQPHAGIGALINCYVVPVGEEQKGKAVVRTRPGLDGMITFATTGGIGGMLEVDGSLYVKAGRILYLVEPGGSAVLVGGIPSDGFLGADRNQRGTGTQAIFASDGMAWIAVGGSLSRILDPDIGAPVDVCVINRSAIFGSSDGRLMRSEIDDATVIDGLDVARASAVPDGLVRTVERGGDLAVIGTRSTEVWRDVGGEAFGFARAEVLNFGAVGPKAVTKATVTREGLGSTIAWVGTNHEGKLAGVFVLSGYQAQDISTPWVRHRLAKLSVSQLGEVTAAAWVERGHGMISLRLPDTALVYDTRTVQWHERQSRDALGNPTTWHVAQAVTFAGRTLVGHAAEPKLYWLDDETHDDDGDELVVTVRTPPLTAEPGRIECNHVYLDVVPGVGLVSGAAQDVNPTVAMRVSRDNETWSGARTRALGAQGQRGRRVSWAGCGTFEQATFEFACSAAVVREFLAAHWDGKALPP